MLKLEKIQLIDNFSVSRIIHGHWRLLEWNFTDKDLLNFTKQIIDLGITTFDHADIYGNYECEKKFGDALKLDTSLRKDLQIITKCGIKLNTDKFPDRKVKYYDYSYDYIIESVNKSLMNFNTDYIDLLLLHRPAPFFNPEEVAKAFYDLKRSGKVLHLGVSNFTQQQFEMLNTYMDDQLVTNQVEISPYCLEHFDNGNIDFFIKNKIKPLAWSPLAGGRIFSPTNDKAQRINSVLKEIASELNVDNIDKIIYSWLFKHPGQIIPIIGSGKIERIKSAIDALSINMTLEQWYRIFIASKGEELP